VSTFPCQTQRNQQSGANRTPCFVACRGGDKSGRGWAPLAPSAFRCDDGDGGGTLRLRGGSAFVSRKVVSASRGRSTERANGRPAGRPAGWPALSTDALRKYPTRGHAFEIMTAFNGVTGHRHGTARHTARCKHSAVRCDVSRLSKRSCVRARARVYTHFSCVDPKIDIATPAGRLAAGRDRTCSDWPQL